MLYGENSGARPTRDADLGVDVLDVAANGLGRYHELLGHSTIGLALSEESEDLNFSVGEPGGPASPRGSHVLARGSKDGVDRARVEPAGRGLFAKRGRGISACRGRAPWTIGNQGHVGTRHCEEPDGTAQLRSRYASVVPTAVETLVVVARHR